MSLSDASSQKKLLPEHRHSQPLAARMRPNSLSDFYGQQHVLDSNTALTTAIKSGDIPSIVFWGPPGTGKTTLAHIIASRIKSRVLILSALTDGIKDIRRVVEEAKQAQLQGENTTVFIDEVHRFNKAQQDALLPHIEQGLFVFIGATTENPSFELNNALLSRVNVYRLELLSVEALSFIIQRALTDCECGLGELGIELPEEQIQQLAEAAGGDARHALTTLEIVAKLATARGVKRITQALIDDCLSEQALHFDKGGDHFYDQISALHKSIRGSAPDAALYWLARMLAGGCDPLYLARRLVRMASEDIGLADPRALRVALDSWEMQERLGSPEGEIGLAQAAVYLAIAPKSNAVYKALKGANKLAQEFGTETVPIHLRNAPTALMKSMGHGEEYRYAHDYPNAYAAGESYLPKSLHGTTIYEPTDSGLESKIQQRLNNWASLDENSDFQRY